MIDDKHQESRCWLDEARNIDKLYCVLIGLCAVLFIADFAVHRHAHFDAEGLYGFYALFGLIAYAFIVGAGWLWRRVVLRKEDYYDD
jgi:hypothetical protein